MAAGLPAPALRAGESVCRPMSSSENRTRFSRPRLPFRCACKALPRTAAHAAPSRRAFGRRRLASGLRRASSAPIRRSCSRASCAPSNSRWSRRSGLCLYLWLRGAGRRLRLRYYVGAIVGIALLVDAGLPGRRHLSGPGVPRPREAIYAARLGVVRGVPARHRRVVLRQGRRRVLAGLARRFYVARPVRADRIPPRTVPVGAALDAAGPARPPHRHGRRRQQRRDADPRARPRSAIPTCA